MDNLWPDPKEVLGGNYTPPKIGSGSLFPDPEKIIGKPMPQVQTPAQKAGHTVDPEAIEVPKPSWKDYLPTWASTKQTAKEIGSAAVELPKSLVTPFTNPSPTELQIEKTASQGGTLNKVTATAVKPIFRLIEPMVEGAGKSLAKNINEYQTGQQMTFNLEDFLNAGTLGMSLAGPITDAFGLAGDKLSTRGTTLKVTPERIGEVLQSDTPMPPQARAILEQLQKNGQGFEMDLKRPAGGLRQTIGEALGGTPERATTFKPTGTVNPQLAAPEPFVHETSPIAVTQLENTQAIQPFAHEPTIVEQGPTPFAAEMGGAMGGNMAVNKPVVNFSDTGITINNQQLNLPKTLNNTAFDYFQGNPVNPDSFAKLAGKVNSIGYDLKNGEVVPLNNESTTLTAELVPGLSKAIEEDIIPKAKSTVQRAKDIYNEIAAMFNPTGQAPAEALDIIMKNKGDYEQTVFRTERAMKSIEKAWDKQPEDNRLAFMEKVETGQEITGPDKELADMYRTRLNNAYNTIKQYKDVNFLENYFPHFWEKPAAVEKNFIPEIMSRRPMEGRKSFLKQRIFETISEGIEAGYKPVSTNPEVLMQIYEQSVAKFKMAQQIKADLQASGMWKVIQHGKPLPSGYTYIDDPIARAYFPQGEIQTPKGPQEHFAEWGRAAAPTPVARLINNHLSPDVLQRSPTYRTLMQAKNSLNAIQLGFSGFHILFTTLDSTITGIDVGISKLARGDIVGAAKEFAKAPFNAYNFFRDGQRFYNGDPELMKIEEDIFHGGASLKEKQYYKSQVFDRFIANVRQGNVVSALGRLPMAAIEGMMRPLFSYYIPRLKVGAFRELFANELERYAKRGQLGDKPGKTAKGQDIKTRETIAREVWNNIENRLGELNYDNLFWNRNFKAVNMLMWRAVGWNLGTIREIGGATVQDFTLFTTDAARGRKPDLTSKMRYTLALLFTMATIGSIYEYLHTGHGPKSLRDMFYPENGATDVNGDPVRVQFPSYLKDMYAYAHEPFKTIGNKLSPEISIIIDILENEDYYKNYVYDPKAGLPQKTAETLKFVLSQIKPFSISNIVQLQKGKATAAEQAESFLGIQKAPQDVSQSERTRAVFDGLSEQGPKTPEEQRLSKLKNEYRKQIQQGNIPTFAELKKAGLVTNAVGYRDFIRNAKLTPVERAYKTLPRTKKQEIPK